MAPPLQPLVTMLDRPPLKLDGWWEGLARRLPKLDDLRVARLAVSEALTRLDARVSRRAPEVHVEELTPSSIDVVARFSIGATSHGATSQPRLVAAPSEAILALEDGFAAHDLTTPFPIRTLDAGVVAGERPREHLGARRGTADAATEAA